MRPFTPMAAATASQSTLGLLAKLVIMVKMNLTSAALGVSPLIVAALPLPAATSVVAPEFLAVDAILGLAFLRSSRQQVTVHYLMLRTTIDCSKHWIIELGSPVMSVG